MVKSLFSAILVGNRKASLEAVEQVNAYADDLLRRYPELTITRHVACTISATDHRFFTLG